jgi:hypothetical protein
VDTATLGALFLVVTLVPANVGLVTALGQKLVEQSVVV